jgi:hypothetical protein
MSLVKVSANFSEEVVEDMKQRAAEQGISMTELLRQALATQKFIQAEQARGTKVILQHAGENDREIIPPLRGKG